MPAANQIVSFDKGYVPDPSEPLFTSIFQQYERVLVESLITSFGLDFIIKDQHGGDVDTIHNVREIDRDPQMKYKNAKNQAAYENRGAYNYLQYHDKNPDYQAMKRDTKKEFQSSGVPIKDAYTGEKVYFYSKGAAKNNSDKQASIDHVQTAHTIHNDRGRVLAGLSGEELANSPDNLVFTNASLNSSMGSTKESAVLVDVAQCIKKYPELTDEERASITNIANEKGAGGKVDVLALIGQQSNLSNELKKKIGLDNKLCVDISACAKMLQLEEKDKDFEELKKLNTDKNGQANIFDIITSKNISSDTKRKIQNSLKEPVDIPRYIELHPELDDRTKAGLMRSYKISVASYEAKLRKKYYTSPEFRKDMTYAAVKVGAGMGLRQALGFVFAEIWFSVEDEWKKLNSQDADLTEYLEAIVHGIEAGIRRAKEKYPELCSRFLSGATAGVLSSVTTTLCNIFFTTAKSTVRIIRQSYASLVEAMKVLFINPDDYEFGDRMRAVVKVLSVGASVTVGVLVGDALERTPLSTLGETGEIVKNFCEAFATGIMSCTLLMYLDRSKTMNALVKCLNNIHTMETELNYYREYAAYFERYAAELMQIDIERFEQETGAFNEIANKLDKIQTPAELNLTLRQAFAARKLPLPWEGFEDFDAFMCDEHAHLVFQ